MTPKPKSLLARAQALPGYARSMHVHTLDDLDLLLAYCSGRVSGVQVAAVISEGKKSRQNASQFLGGVAIWALRRGLLVRAK